MQAGNVGIESLLGSWLYVLVTKGIIDTGGTFTNQFLQHSIVDASQQQHIFTDVLVHRVVAPLVSHVGIEVINLRVDCPFSIPKLSDGHSNIHHPTE